MSKISNDKLFELAQAYNREGRKAFYELLKSEYGIKSPYAVFKRIGNKEGITYIEEEDRFEIECDKQDNDADVFMSIDELCNTKPKIKQQQPQEGKQQRSEAMEKLVRDLIGDRLLELSKYITMDSISKRILIDQTSLRKDGYRMETL